jgi:hypothetical protein
MRPNIQITHTLNGRVKDFAAERDLDLSTAYRLVIEGGLDGLDGAELYYESNNGNYHRRDCQRVIEDADPRVVHRVPERADRACECWEE